MAPPEPGRTLIRWHWQEERLSVASHSELVHTKRETDAGIEVDTKDPCWDAFVLAVQGATVFHPFGRRSAALENEQVGAIPGVWE